MNKLLAVLCLVARCAFGASPILVDLLPTTNTPAWQPGIPGGIPVYTFSVDIHSYGFIGDGIHDDYPAFTNALAHCADGGYVDVNATVAVISNKVQFTYPMNRSFKLHNTLIKAYTGNAPAFSWGEDTTRQGNVSVSSGYTRSSQQLTLSSVVGISVSNLVRFIQQNDPAEWFGGGEFGAPVQGQMGLITNISGNVITLDTPIYYSNYNASFFPYVDAFTHPVNYCGLDGGIINYQGTYPNALYAYVGWNNWITNVICTNSVNSVLSGLDQLRFTAQQCTLSYHQAYDSNARYCAQFSEYCTACLIENSILQGGNAGVIFQEGACGNVAGYNYTDQGWLTGFNGAAGGYSDHGDLGNFNLFEGNITAYTSHDNTWGANRTSLTFRDWLRRVCTTITGSQSTVGPALFIDSTNYYHSAMGCILGLPSQAGFSDSANPTFCVGYDRNGGHNPPGAVNDPNAVNRCWLNQNFDWATQTTFQSNSVPLPNSYYLPSKPTWWGTLTNWPMAGPDVNITSTITNYPIQPAQARWLGVNIAQRIARITNLHVGRSYTGP